MLTAFAPVGAGVRWPDVESEGRPTLRARPCGIVHNPSRGVRLSRPMTGRNNYENYQEYRREEGGRGRWLAMKGRMPKAKSGPGT